MFHVVMYENVGLSPAWDMVSVANTELRDACMHEHPVVPPNWATPCLVAYADGGQIVGMLVYNYVQERGVWWVHLAYTVPQFRGRGVFRTLYDTLVKRAKLRGDILSIELMTHEANHSARATYEAVGMEPVGRMYSNVIRLYEDYKDPLKVEK